jgi:ferric-dicitrate binding protein FerR (iron transport regulator)
MDHIKLKKLTKYYLEGRLSQDNEQKLLTWIKASEANKKLFLKEQEYISSTIIKRKDKEVGLKWKALQQRIGSVNRNSRAKVIFMRAASIAAAFIIGVLLTVYVVSQHDLGLVHTAQIQKINTPYGAKTNIELPDGSYVCLNSGSELSFPNSFGKERTVTLVGEAFFEVEKNEKPFIVSTNYGEVEVKGTSFNVKAFNDDSFQATLVNGIVNVREANSGKEVTLSPGQQAAFIRSDIEVRQVETELFTSWKEGKLIFIKEHLPDVAKRLERWYNVNIELTDDKRLSEIWYSGTIEMESFSEVLELLKLTAPIDYIYNQKTRTINIFYK